MLPTHDQFLLLLKRIHISWRWDKLYTAIYNDGKEKCFANPEAAPIENLIGIYNGMIGLKDLKEDFIFSLEEGHVE